MVLVAEKGAGWDVGEGKGVGVVVEGGEEKVYH